MAQLQIRQLVSLDRGFLVVGDSSGIFMVFPVLLRARCIYWVMYLVDKLLVLYTSKMVLSTINFQRDQDFAILETEEDMIGAFCLRGDLSGRTHIYYATRRIDADSADGPPLNLDKTIPLPLSLDYCFGIINATQGYLLLQGRRLHSSGRTTEEDDTDILYFTLEPKTMLVEKVCGMSRQNVIAKMHTGFSPSLSLPSL